MSFVKLAEQGLMGLAGAHVSFSEVNELN